MTSDYMRQAGEFLQVKPRLQHVSRRKYIQQMMRPYRGVSGNTRRKYQRVMGYAYDDIASGCLTLF